MIIWDRIFGTYAPLEEAPAFGIDHMPARPRNPFYVELYLWGALLRRRSPAQNMWPKLK